MATEVWIFLRGLTRSAGHWGAFVAEFEVVHPQARVLTLDLPGNGALWAQSSPTSVAHLMQDCRAQWQALGHTGPVRLLAMSLGAMVALEWAQRYPNEVLALVLINTSVRRFSPFYARLRPTNYGKLLRLVLWRRHSMAIERDILHMTTRHAGHDVLQDWVQLRKRYPVSVANAIRQLWAAAHFDAGVRAPVMPLLVLGGEGDQLVAVRCSQALAVHWGCAIRLHPSAGHDLPLDDGPWVALQVRQWLLDSPLPLA